MSEYKFIIFFAAVFLGVPFAVALSLRSTLFRKVMIFGAIFLTCFLRLHINFESMEWYRGSARGFEVTVVDLCVLVLFLTLLGERRKFRWTPAGWYWYVIYTGLSALSIWNAAQPIFSWFELWKMVRFYFFFLVMYNLLLNPANLRFMLNCLIAVVMFVFLNGLKEKYLDNGYQLRSTFPHQNSMCMYMALLGTVFLSAAYNCREGAKRVGIYVWTFGCCSLMVVFSLSRGGMFCYALGCLVTFAVSNLCGVNRRKVLITTLLMLCAAAVMAKVAEHVYLRYTNAPVESKNDRIALAVAAAEMANSRFLGVGLNQFGETMNQEYTVGLPLSERSLEVAPRIYRWQLVETVYLMIASECGWITLAVFLMMLLYYYCLNLRLIVRLKGNSWRFLCIGWAGGLAAIYCQSSLEWVLKQSANYYELMLAFASVCALDTLSKSARRKAAAAVKKRPALRGGEKQHPRGGRIEDSGNGGGGQDQRPVPLGDEVPETPQSQRRQQRRRDDRQINPGEILP